MNSILGSLTIKWMTEDEIERRANRPVANGLEYLLSRGLIWKMVDVGVAKYCRPHDVGDPLIGKSHVGRLAAPVWEAAE